MSSEWARPGRVHQVTVGEVVATYLPDGHVELHPDRWFAPTSTGRELEARPELISSRGMLVGSIGALLLEGPDWRLLVDAGLGPAHVPAEANHPALGAMHGGELRSHAARLTGVDAVVFTHWHDDHVGWARAGWPGFAGVRAVPHLIGQGEMAPAHWRRVMEGEEVAPGVRVLRTPGHTPGHLSLLVTSGHRRLLVLGDVMHSPAQVEHPYLASCFDTDIHASGSSRSRVLHELAVPGTVGAATHFADVPFGTLREGRWAPVTDMLVVPPPG